MTSYAPGRLRDRLTDVSAVLPCKAMQIVQRIDSCDHTGGYTIVDLI